MLPYSNNPNKRKLKRLIMMKRLLFSLAFIAIFFSFSQAQTYVQIGNGAESSSMPYTSWSYSWSKALYHSGDLGGTKTITKIALESEGTKTLNNQKIYLKTTTDDALTGTYENPASSGYTLVYDGNYSVTAGWNELALDTQFDYNGSDNLIVYWINENGSEVTVNFTATSTNEEVIKVAGGDNSVPTSDGFTAYPQALPNIQFYYASDAPANPSNPVPAHNRVKVNLDTSLTFDIGENTSHYDVCFGTDKDNLDTIVDNQSVASAGTFTHSIDTLLQGEKKYYWQVIAINDTLGERTNSAVWNFTTEGKITNYPWSVGFEDVWEGVGGQVWSSVINTNYPDSTYWKWTKLSWGLETDSNQVGGNVHSGHFGAQCSAGDEGTFNLRTPRFILPSDMRVSYWFRNGGRRSTKASNNDTTMLQITTDGGTNWITLDTIAPDTLMESWERHIVELSGYSSDNVYLRWVYKVSQTDATRYFFLDDVKVEPKPDGPVIDLGVTDISYKKLCVGGKINEEVVISNTGVSDLTISGTDITGDFECSYTGTIPPGEKDTAIVSFKPASVGSHNDTITFNSNAGYGESEIHLTGDAVEAVSSFYQGFDDSDDLPSSWNSVNSPDGYTSGGGVDIVSFSGDVYSKPNAAKILMSNDTVNPLLLISKGVTNYVENQLTFYAKKASKNYDLKMQVGVMSNPYDASTFIPKTTISLDTAFRKDTITFKPTTSKPYIAFKHHGNPNGKDKWTSLRIDNISWDQGEPSKPIHAENLGPKDDTSNLDIMNPFDLKWSSGSGNTDGFYLYFGKDTTSWEIINQDTLADNETSHPVETELEYSTTYFWKIVPYNDVGKAEQCPVWSFTTMSDPVINDFAWTEDFDDTQNADGYTMPLGWSNQDKNDDNATWDLWTDNPENGAEYSKSAPNAMYMGLSLFNPENDYLFTPPFEFEKDKEYKLTFWWASQQDPTTGKIYKERMKIFIGDDNRDTSLTRELFNDSISTDAYQKDSILFKPETDGRKYLSFYAYSVAQQNYILSIDDIKITVNNSVPVFTSQPDTVVTKGDNYNYEISCTDEDGDAIEISGKNLPGWLSLNDNGDGTAVLSGVTSNAGAYSVAIVADDGKGQTTQEFTLEVNRKPEFTSDPRTELTLNDEYSYEIVCQDADDDKIEITASNIPSWLTLTDNGDGTGSLTGKASSTGSYDVKLSAKDDYVAVIQEFTIEVSENKAPQFASTPDETVIKGNTYNYSINCTDANNDSIDIEGKTVPSWLTLTDNGDGTGVLSGKAKTVDNYDVEVIATDGSDQTLQKFVIKVEEGTTSISRINNQEVSIYPNPSNGHITVELDNTEKYKTEDIKLMDFTGKLVKQIEIEGTKTSVDLYDLNPGIYLIQVGSLKNRVTEKIILK
jgi:hypothetical protein